MAEHPLSRQLRHLQEQINALASAPLGPVTLGPHDSIVLVNGGVQTARLTSAGGLEVRMWGSLQSLATAMESERTARVGGDSNLQSNINTVQANVNSLSTSTANALALKANITAMNLKASITSTNSALSTLASAINALAGRITALENGDSVTPGTSTPIPSPPVVTT